MGGYFRYTKEQEDIIRREYPNTAAAVIAEKLGKNETAIGHKARKLKVRKNPPSYLSSYGVARLLRIHQRRGRVWLLQGLLKGSKTGRGSGVWQEWRIEVSDFQEFVKNHYHLFRTERIIDRSLLQIIATTPAGRFIPICQAVRVLGVSRATAQRWARKGALPAYKGLGPRGRLRYYVQLDGTAFEWFFNLSDDRAAGWLVETVRCQNHNAMEMLDILIKCEPEKLKEVRRRIRGAVIANGIVRQFEETSQGERFKILIN